MNNKEIVQLLEQIYQVIATNKEWLNQLDRSIGDGDHGTNMLRGFQAVIDKKDKLRQSSPKEIFNSISFTLMSTVGGASGPFYASIFMNLGLASDENAELFTFKQFSKGLTGGLQMIKRLGKAELGDKTMVDVLEPIVTSLNEIMDFKSAVQSGHKGMQNSEFIIAKKGRAAYLGQRSIGHLDPGSVSMDLIFSTILKGVN